MKKRKWRDVKNALVMVVVMAAMMSTATYAWFTLTSNATVTGMQMTAGGSSGLQVSLNRSDWADTVDLTDLVAEGEDPNQTIHQVTVMDNDPFVAEFYKPVYEESKVTNVEKIANADVPTYVAKYTYYIRSIDASALVGIKTASGVSATDGSYIRATDANDENSAARAVRVGIVVDGEMHIFEPNNEAGENAGTEAVSEYAGTYTSDVIATDGTGVITTENGNNDNHTSTDLFTAVSGEGKEVTMYVWLEGTDDDCVNEIQADELAGQIMFTIVSPDAP